VLQAPTCQGDPLGQADQALTGPRAGRGRTGGGGVVHLDRQALAGCPPRGRPPRRRGVLARVGQRLLHDPVGGAAHAVGRRAADLGAQVHPHPGPGRLGDQQLHVGHGGLGQLADRGAQHADDLAQVLQRLVGALPDHPGGAGDLLGGGVRVVLQRAGVHAQQRQPVAEHVVHLPGDLPAGAVLGLLGTKPRPGLRRRRTLPQRQRELAPVADEQAPADRGALHGDAQQEQQEVGHPGLGAHHDVDERGEQAQREHHRGGPRRPVHHDREQPHHHRGGHQLRERRQGHQHHGQPDRPTAAPPQGGGAEGGGDRVQGEHP